MSGKFWDKAWSLIEGCTPVSAGCDNCWLAAMDYRFKKGLSYITDFEIPYFTGEVRFREDRLDIPLRTRKPTVFAIWSDLYHETVTDEQLEEVFHMLPNHHIYLIVTKRPERAAAFFSTRPGLAESIEPEYNNVYHLITVENQKMADKRIPHALKIPGKVGLLIEPMLGPVDLSTIGGDQFGQGRIDALNGIRYVRANALEQSSEWETLPEPKISFALLGGETGPHVRPMNPDWARSVRDQCHMSGVPFFLKFIDKKHGRVLDEQEHNELPWRVK